MGISKEKYNYEYEKSKEYEKIEMKNFCVSELLFFPEKLLKNSEKKEFNIKPTSYNENNKYKLINNYQNNKRFVDQNFRDYKIFDKNYDISNKKMSINSNVNFTKKQDMNTPNFKVFYESLNSLLYEDLDRKYKNNDFLYLNHSRIDSEIKIDQLNNNKFFINLLDNNDIELKRNVIRRAICEFLNCTLDEKLIYETCSKYLRFHINALVNAVGLLKTTTIKSSKTIFNFKIIFLSFCIISLKYYDDFSIWNSKYNSCWNLTLNEIAELERIAIHSINYKVEININLFKEIILNAYNDKIIYNRQNY